MKKSQQGAAVAVVAIGLIVLAIGTILLISQLLEERAARQRLEQEAAEMRQEIENLKTRRIPRPIIASMPSSWGAPSKE